MGIDISFAEARDLVAAAFLLVGLFFMFVGALGVFRMPDAYHRLHAMSLCTTLGIASMLIGACLHAADAAMVSKALVAIVFIVVANPIGSHLIAKAAHHSGAPIWPGTRGDELAADKADATMSVCDDLSATHGEDSPCYDPRPRRGARAAEGAGLENQ